MADWVLVPCPGRRTGELLRLAGDLKHDSSFVCVVTTQPDPVHFGAIECVAKHLVVLGEEIHYGKWLNAGMSRITAVDPEARYAFITGSDTRGDTQTVPALTQGADALGLVMCGPDHWHLGSLVFDTQLPRSLAYRVPPEYFLFDLRTGIRFDEQFRWWYSEDDLEMQVRRVGRVGLVSGVNVGQPDAPGGHGLNGRLGDWAIEDRAKFVRKWGVEPW